MSTMDVNSDRVLTESGSMSTAMSPWGPVELDVPSGARRESILDAAEAVFARQGVAATTMAQLAGEAGISRELLYRHFANRDAVASALLARGAERFIAGMAGAPSTGDLVEDLVACALFAIRFLRHDELLQRLIGSEPETILPFVTSESGPVLTMAVEAATAAVAVRAQLSPRRAAWVGEAVVRFVHAVAFTPNAVVDFDDPRQARPMIRALVAGVVAAASG
jgi:AcrR family transcriptional regulator